MPSDNHIPMDAALRSPPPLDLLRVGDAAAWDAAYPLLWTAAANVVRHRLGVSDIDFQNVVSQVICEEVMPGLIDPGKSSFRSLGHFDELLALTRVIAQRRCIDRIRTASRRKETLTDQPPEPDGTLQGSREHNSLDWKEWMTLIQEVLDPPDSDLFHDRFALGYTTREIAERRGMPHGTVVSRFSRAFSRLSTSLEKRGLFDRFASHSPKSSRPLQKKGNSLQAKSPPKRSAYEGDTSHSESQT